MFVEFDERRIFIVLPRDVCADLAKVDQLFFDLPGRNFYVGLDSFEELGMVHFRSCISDNLDVFGKEIVSVLRWSVNRDVWRSTDSCKAVHLSEATYEAEQCWEL